METFDKQVFNDFNNTLNDFYQYMDFYINFEKNTISSFKRYTNLFLTNEICKKSNILDSDGVLKLKFNIFRGEFNITSVENFKSFKNMPIESKRFYFKRFTNRKNRV